MLILAMLACKSTAIELDDPGKSPGSEESGADDSGQGTGDDTGNSTVTEGEVAPIVVGRTYVVDIGNATIVEPPGVGALLGSLIDTNVLIGVTAADSRSLSTMGATESEFRGQDYCTPTIPFPVADFSAQPYFELGPADTELSFAGYQISVRSLRMTGSFASDGSYFDEGTLEGSIDARDIAEAFPDLGYSGEQLCEFMVSFGVSCEACDDGEDFCLAVVVEDILAEEDEGVTLVEVADSDCPGCESGPPDPEECTAD